MELDVLTPESHPDTFEYTYAVMRHTHPQKYVCWPGVKNSSLVGLFVSYKEKNISTAPGACTTKLSGAQLWGRLLASPTNIRLGWKGLPETNTQA
jgi:hypothetical protein